MYLPTHFMQELERVHARQRAREHHLMLFGHEGLHVLERWRTMRHFAGPFGAQVLYSRRHFPYSRVARPRHTVRSQTTHNREPGMPG